VSQAAAIPESLRVLFWDVDRGSFDPAAHPAYTILRVLEFGDEAAAVWLRSRFTDAQIREVIREERRLSPKSANYWALVYGIPEDQVAALR
jgi:hypothetical protein